MRRTPSTRVGAFGLALLMQVFVASSLLHPCCLAKGMEGAGASSVAAGASSHDGGDVPAGSHAAHGGGMDHGGSMAGSHTGHEEPGESGCDGACGFCCQVAGVLGLPALPAVLAGPDLGLVVAPTPARAAILVSATAHLRPWANAPPTPRSASA